jgi:ferrochelatase
MYPSADHPPPPRTSTPPPPLGVLLTNLGTPTAPTAAAVRPFLREFLADPRVVGLPRVLWLPLLHGVIAPLRAPRAAAAYRRIWGQPGEAGAPLRVGMTALAARLGESLSARLEREVRVVAAMRYGTPGIAPGLASLAAAGARRVLIFPLYPQYAAATTATTLDAVGHALQRVVEVPDLRFIGAYHREPAYLGALATSVQLAFAAHGRPERLLLSFHGLPERQAQAGDPYPQHCQETAERLAGLLDLRPGTWELTFQSRFGPARWLGPATDARLRALAGEGVRSVQICCPGFAVECLETLEEIEIRYREVFLAAGGAEYSYIPALGAGEDHVAALTAIAGRHLVGW